MNDNNLKLNELQKQQLKQARNSLIIVQHSIPQFFEEYMKIDEMVEVIEKLLGII